ncbi:ATPase, T2SS/T4P/T4SS family [Ancylobacter sp.]|uniref:ATPase, T2SS/T4P/T4SS family n=1 Tax=Ancylobacter sp. TaxID=1872567 RepID=UPI003BA9A6E8
MAAAHHQGFARGARMLRTALGPAIARHLEDPDVIEVMLNPDGRLWIDRLSEGLGDTGEKLSPADGERIVRLVAHHVGAEVHAGAPRASAELPETGERFEGLLPPVVAAATFAIRKPAVAVFTLEDYVRAGIMSAAQAGALRQGVASRANILVAGGTSTGKTTLTNALLAEVAKTEDRVVLIEDTRELQAPLSRHHATRFSPSETRGATPLATRPLAQQSTISRNRIQSIGRSPRLAWRVNRHSLTAIRAPVRWQRAREAGCAAHVFHY